MSYSAVKSRVDLPELGIGNAALLIAGVSIAALAGAWLIELMGYPPCPLCLEQRIAYYIAIPLGLVAAFFALRAPRFSAALLAALSLAFIYNAGLGVYHAGAEWHFWSGPATCLGDAPHITSLSKSLQHNQAVSCTEAALRIFGISLAGYNALISVALTVAGGLALWRDRTWRS
jgi:disulfide bond formation protein DsbB